jgi:hypothetical protein
MNNKEIYKKTLTFSIRRFGWDLLSVVVITLFTAAGVYLASVLNGPWSAGLCIGLLIGIVVMAIASHFISYVFKAGQIAMMTEGVTTGKLPDDVYAAGKKVVKERFATVAVYYAVTGAIKGIFNQLGNVIMSVGNAVGGDTGSAIGSTISAVLQTIVNYLCDCCLGWVFYKKDESSFKATMEGAVLYFRHGKTFFKNMGRVFGIGFLSFLVIGGVFFGIFYLITMAFQGGFADLANWFATEGEDIPEFFTHAGNLMLTTAGIGGLVMWGILHSVFVRPFVLVGVLRNFIASGKDEEFSEGDFDELDKKSAKFKKIHAEAK